MLSLSDIVEAQARQRPARMERASDSAAAGSPRTPERFTLEPSSRPERPARARDEARAERRQPDPPREAERMRPPPDRKREASETTSPQRPPTARRETGASDRPGAETRRTEPASAPRSRIAQEPAGTENAVRGETPNATSEAEDRAESATESVLPEAPVSLLASSPSVLPAEVAPSGTVPDDALDLASGPPDAATSAVPLSTLPPALSDPAVLDSAASELLAAPAPTAQAAPGEATSPGVGAVAAQPGGSGRQESSDTPSDQTYAAPVQDAGEAAPGLKADSATLGFAAALAATEPTTAESWAGPSPTATATGESDVKASSPSAAQPTATVPASAHPVPLGAVPMTIGLRALQGMNRFELRLDPAELGRIDVALEIDTERGAVSARVVVERPETLALLQRDSGSLQQALTQAGFDAGAAISLSLRADGEGRSGERRDMQGFSGASGPQEGDEGPIGPAETAPLTALRGLGGIDIRI